MTQQQKVQSNIDEMFGKEDTKLADNEALQAMFGEATESADNEALQELAENLAIKDYQLSILKKDIISIDGEVQAMKAQLCQAMIDKGISKLSFENGLSPSKAIKMKYFKAKGVDDETLNEWLKAEGLGDIIKPYVHFQTLQSSLGAYADSGKDLPDIINQSEELSVRLNGKSKFLKLKGLLE